MGILGDANDDPSRDYAMCLSVYLSEEPSILDRECKPYPTGALGYFSLDGTTDLSVVIRTMVLEGDRE